MRRGCIAVEKVRCDSCGKDIRHPERYFLIEEGEEQKAQRFCSECSLKRGYASYRMEKGEKILTFLESETKE